MVEKIEVKIWDEDGSRNIPAKIPKTFTIDRFVTELKKKLNLSPDANYDAVLERSGSILPKKKTISEAGIQDGDVIVLRHTGEGGIR